MVKIDLGLHIIVAGARLSPTATALYRPFGGGSTLCPGRHFAATEVLALTAMVVHQYGAVGAARGMPTEHGGECVSAQGGCVGVVEGEGEDGRGGMGVSAGLRFGTSRGDFEEVGRTLPMFLFEN